MLIRTTLLILSCSLLLSCSTTYTPFTHAPLAPMTGGEIEGDVTYESEFAPSGGITDGLRTGLRLGLSNRVTIAAQAWTSEEEFWNMDAGGLSIESFFLADEGEKFDLGLHGRYSILLAGQNEVNVVGQAFQAGPILWGPRDWTIRMHGASEVGYGWNVEELVPGDSSAVESALLWTQEIGAGIELPLNFQFKTELLSSLYYTIGNGEEDGAFHWMLMPQATLSWGFDFSGGE